MASNRYCVEISKRGTAGCKECKVKIEKGIVRIAKIIPNPFTETESDMKQWFHPKCIFEKLTRARATTKKIDSTDDLEGFDDLSDEHKEEVLKFLSEFSPQANSKKTPQKISKKATKSPGSTSPHGSSSQSGLQLTPKKAPNALRNISLLDKSLKSNSADDSFREFRKLCSKLADESTYTEKIAIAHNFFSKGSSGSGFTGDLCLWVRLLLPMVDPRVYNLRGKQLVKLYSEIFDTRQEEMLEHLEQGDLAETISVFFEESQVCPPTKKSMLSLQELDSFLLALTEVTRESDQRPILEKVAKKCTSNDLKMFVRLISKDLRIKAGPKHILQALHADAFEAFQATRNLEDILYRAVHDPNSLKDVGVQTLTPVKPMLAQACSSAEEAVKKCPNGMLIEIKYDGERVQLHKKGNEFTYFSRSLKPVMPYKVAHLKDYIPQAFLHGNSLILDSEILCVDSEGKPLPFGSLNVHKKKEFKDATVCLFVFDCIQFNDQNLMNRPLEERRKILEQNMTPIKNRVIISELKPVDTANELKEIIDSVIEQGLEGLMIKDRLGVYEPGKRHWLKIKNSYLKDKKMVDSADLVVLGGYFGTGKKGGILSTFLMGCYDPRTEKWSTVTKVPGGTDDTLERLQRELKPKMRRIMQDMCDVPAWLRIKKPLIPDFIVYDPKESPVWEIGGAEFSKAELHTADGISIRFPRVARIRNDKTWKEATNLQELHNLFTESKKTTDLVGLSPTKGSANSSPVKTPIKRKVSQMTPEGPLSKMMKKSETSSGEIFEPESNKSDNRLPNIFSGVKLVIPSSLEKADLLRRYFIAYDGDLLKDHETNEANFVIATDNSEKNGIKEDFESVTPDWLWDCIKLQKKIDTKCYKPKR